ncbi:type IV secretory system conjugative DNA transfer family protein [Bacillus sp. CRN 9]|nr:type IV secretory system conjugative DNA transfer family protein [Bacillus sp. CRN 9]
MNKDIVWGGDDPYTHMLAVGPTRCGKTATILTPIIYQILLQKAQGKKVGLSVIEPKGDLAVEVKEFCDVMGIPYIYIDPESEETHRFNVMEGNKDDVAEATVAVLQSLFGKQEAFFQTVQELSTRNITKLLKQLHGDDMDLLDVLTTLRSQSILEQKVKELKKREGQSDLVDFFENELLGSLAENYRKLVIGLRAQIENITGNEKLRRIITGKSDINIDKHFEEGGVLIVNTSLGTLKKAGDAFGQFVTMHLQSGTFRRKGTEKTRTPHFLISDEYSRYINPDVEMFLSIAASYRVSGIFAIQSLGQLEVESGKLSAKAMKAAILTSCRNKIAFCGLSAQDAKEFAEEFGKDKVVMRQSTYRNRIFLPRFFPDTYRDTETEEYRFHYTYLQDEMKRFHFICRILNDGTPQRPIEGVGKFVPRDWKERKEWLAVKEPQNKKWLFIDTYKFSKVQKTKKLAAKKLLEEEIDNHPSNKHQHPNENEYKSSFIVEPEIKGNQTTHVVRTHVDFNEENTIVETKTPVTLNAEATPLQTKEIKEDLTDNKSNNRYKDDDFWN